MARAHSRPMRPHQRRRFLACNCKDTQRTCRTREPSHDVELVVGQRGAGHGQGELLQLVPQRRQGLVAQLPLREH